MSSTPDSLDPRERGPGSAWRLAVARELIAIACLCALGLVANRTAAADVECDTAVTAMRNTQSCSCGITFEENRSMLARS